MNHIHLDQVTSTQTYIEEHFPEISQGVLISCEKQTHGQGQHNRVWTDFDSSLALSFSLTPCSNITLTSLEVPVLIRRYFKSIYNTECLFKWPNDLINFDHKKCGGILIKKIGNNDLMVGIGINLNPITEDSLLDAGSIFKKKVPIIKKSIAHKLYDFILNNRLEHIEIIEEWNHNCVHMNKDVTISDHDKLFKGKFIGIGSNGQAVIESSEGLKDFYSGSLLI